MNEKNLRKILKEVVDESIETKTRVIVQEIVQEETGKILDLMTEYANSVDNRLDALESDVAAIKDTIRSYPITENMVRISYRQELDDHKLRIKRLEAHLPLPQHAQK